MHEARALLSYDLSSIPSDVTIKSATLELKYSTYATSPWAYTENPNEWDTDAKLSIHNVTTPFSANEIETIMDSLNDKSYSKVSNRSITANMNSMAQDLKHLHGYYENDGSEIDFASKLNRTPYKILDYDSPDKRLHELLV